MHTTQVVPPGSIWHYQICHHQQILQNHSTQWGSTENLQSHMTQLLHKGTLSTIQNISTVIPYQTQHTRSPTVTTALSTSLITPFWPQNHSPLISYMYNAGRPGPLPTKFLCIATSTANTDLPTDHPTATRPSCAWQPTDLLTCKPLCASAPTLQYQLHYHPHLSRQPKHLWYNQTRVTPTTPTTADKNLLWPP